MWKEKISAQNSDVPNKKTVYVFVSKFRQRRTKEDKRELDENPKCLLSRNWMKLVAVFNIPHESPLDALQRRLGFRV
jgi:hypothetical protein